MALGEGIETKEELASRLGSRARVATLTVGEKM